MKEKEKLKVAVDRALIVALFGLEEDEQPTRKTIKQNS